MRESCELQRASAGWAEMSARRHRSAPRAVAGRTSNCINGLLVAGRASPNHRDNPTDHRPAKQEIQDKYAREVSLLVADDRGQEIQQRNREKKHNAPSLLSYDLSRQFVSSVLLFPKL